MPTIKVAVVDDHKQFRETISATLEAEPDMEVVLRAKNGQELIALLPTCKPDVILMDIQMPVMGGIEATQRVLAAHPTMKIIALSLFDNEVNIVKMNSLGVKSFVAKENAELLPKAIRIVYEGDVYFPNQVATKLQTYLGKFDTKETPNDLTEAELTLIRLILEGNTSKQIGEKICRSHRTVEDMREKLYLKLQITTKEQLIILATKWGLD